MRVIDYFVRAVQILKSNNDNGAYDKIRFGDQVKIHLIRDGRTIKTIIPKQHTWTSNGLTEIAKWLVNESAVVPASIGVNGTGATTITAYPSRSGTICIWTSTFPSSGDISNITTFYLVGSGITFATKSVPSFTKPNGTGLIVEWRTTIGV